MFDYRDSEKSDVMSVLGYSQIRFRKFMQRTLRIYCTKEYEHCHINIPCKIFKIKQMTLLYRIVKANFMSNLVRKDGNGYYFTKVQNPKTKLRKLSLLF